MLRRELEIREKADGPESPILSSTLNGLGKLSYYKFNYTEAESLYKRALSVDERVWGSQHPYVAYELNNLGLLYFDQRKYKEAEPLYMRALAIRKRRSEWSIRKSRAP